MIEYEATVVCKWTYNIKEHLESKGYTFTGFFKEVEVKVKDLLPSSNVKVPVKCDICNEKVYLLQYYNASRNKKQICPDCNGKNLRNIMAYSYDYIKNAVEEVGFTMLSTEKEYLSKPTMKSKLKMICPEGHPVNLTFYEWQNGRKNKIGYRCSKCNKLAPPTIETISVEMAKAGFGLNTDKYENSYTLLSVICPNGGTWLVSWNDWQKRQKTGKKCGCYVCTGIPGKNTIQPSSGR